MTWAVLDAHGLTASAEVEGRDRAPASIDQPRVTEGSWIRNGGVVVERTFAEALGVHTGDSIMLNGRPVTVAGIAVTAAFSPYPDICSDGCDLNTPQLSNTPGLVWVTQDEARSLSSFEEPLTYYLNLKLSDPAQAVAFANKYNFNSAVTPSLYAWQQISQDDGTLLKKEQLVLMVASWLLGLLAVASVAVLVGGRMAEQIRRVGLLKAAGGTPGLIAGVAPGRVSAPGPAGGGGRAGARPADRSGAGRARCWAARNPGPATAHRGQHRSGRSGGGGGGGARQRSGRPSGPPAPARCAPCPIRLESRDAGRG